MSHEREDTMAQATQLSEQERQSADFAAAQTEQDAAQAAGAALSFSFSDTIAGYVTDFDSDLGTFGLKTTDGRIFRATLTPTTFALLVRNLNEPYADATANMQRMLVPGAYVYTYGVFYPNGADATFEANNIIFTGRAAGEYVFERPDWWQKQIEGLGDFYLQAQFADGSIDYANYRTVLRLEGAKTGDVRQETDTISRLVYGFASAFMMSGDDRYLEAAEAGTRYLRDHLRFVDTDENVTYWYHAVDIGGRREQKIFASEFGDDYDAIPMYEQIYALAGPTQTMRITGDPEIMEDIEGTLRLFEKFFHDRERGGYYSHIDPVTMDARAESLGRNRGRKNWNSVGDHAPAYLINLYLATGEQRHLDFLKYTADTIADRFPDFQHSPFVQERFNEDWTADTTWGWQQNRAVVGHNLKIAWNLMRIHHAAPSDKYVALAHQIAQIMPPIGSDLQRGGWYDVMERTLKDGQSRHRFTWHDRKAWWQQEQAILAYLILAGSAGDEEHLRLGRESAAFYNAFFLDHDDGGVYFNVLANGLPYLLGTERFKGSHSMSNYHASELCYLASVYSNLLIAGHPMDLYFKPQPGALKDGILRVAPDILPPGRVRIGSVLADGRHFSDFDADALTIRVPASQEAIKFQVRLVPVVRK
jgi:mannose/cellobiose epimerase-like protein (N-acyl-D-glucosamine 2-epimerase family)